MNDLFQASGNPRNPDDDANVENDAPPRPTHHTVPLATRMRPTTLDQPVAVHDHPENQVARRQAAELARNALDSLDERRRMVFVLVEFEQMTAPEVASTLSIPLNTVYSRLRTARREFEQAIRRRSETRKDARGGP